MVTLSPKARAELIILTKQYNDTKKRADDYWNEYTAISAAASRAESLKKYSYEYNTIASKISTKIDNINRSGLSTSEQGQVRRGFSNGLITTGRKGSKSQQVHHVHNVSGRLYIGMMPFTNIHVLFEKDYSGDIRVKRELTVSEYNKLLANITGPAKRKFETRKLKRGGEYKKSNIFGPYAGRDYERIAEKLTPVFKVPEQDKIVRF
jgi:hypothetical protein